MYWIQEFWWKAKILFADFATVPPGFSAGVTFERKNLMDFIGFDTKAPSVVYLSDLLGQGQDIDLAEDETELNENAKTPLKDSVINKEVREISNGICAFKHCTMFFVSELLCCISKLFLIFYIVIITLFAGLLHYLAKMF